MCISFLILMPAESIVMISEKTCESKGSGVLTNEVEKNLDLVCPYKSMGAFNTLSNGKYSGFDYIFALDKNITACT